MDGQKAVDNLLKEIEYLTAVIEWHKYDRWATLLAITLTNEESESQMEDEFSDLSMALDALVNYKAQIKRMTEPMKYPIMPKLVPLFTEWGSLLHKREVV
jgi:hypothetical protein